jgi:hypothetical protein
MDELVQYANNPFRVKVRWKIFYKAGSKQIDFENKTIEAEPENMIKLRLLMDSFKATLERVAKGLDWSLGSGDYTGAWAAGTTLGRDRGWGVLQQSP